MSGSTWHFQSLASLGPHRFQCSPIEQHHGSLVLVLCVVERDKLDASVLAAPVKVRNLHVDLERLRYGGQLYVVCQSKKKKIRAIMSFVLSARAVKDGESSVENEKKGKED